jgi:adenosylmethionine-8-amino-7-oxononanoate aminotransferase
MSTEAGRAAGNREPLRIRIVPKSNVFPRSAEHLPFAEHAEGVYIFDSDGNTFIDAAGGALVVGIGHGDGAVVDALADQARRVSYAHGTQFTSDALEAYASELAELLPVDDARVYPVSGGSEAVETALKMARAYHLGRGEDSRFKVIARTGSYHGNSLNALDASGRPALRKPYLPWLGRSVHVPTPYEYRCSFDGHDRCGLRHAELLDEAIRREGPDQVACFVAEPVVGAAIGAVVPPDDYWPAIREVCSAHGVLVIADEVMTGFGRTGRWFGCDHWNVTPDIIAAGKGASSGYWPLGFAACSASVFETINRVGFTHGFTFSHSVVGAAVGRAVLMRLKGDDLVAASQTRGEQLKKELNVSLSGHPHVGEVRGLGLMVGVELVEDRSTKKPFDREVRVTEQVIAAAKERGLLLYPSTAGADGVNGDVLMLGPPFVVTADDIEEIVGRLSDALAAVAPVK